VYLRSSKRRQTRRRDVLRRLQAQDQLLRPGASAASGRANGPLGTVWLRVRSLPPPSVLLVAVIIRVAWPNYRFSGPDIPAAIRIYDEVRRISAAFTPRARASRTGLITSFTM
jgi:hypothetical protein